MPLKQLATQGWEMYRLSDIVEAPIVYGIVQAGPHTLNGVPYIRSSDVGGRIVPETLSRTTPEIARKYRRSEVRPGDIIFSLRGNTGQVSVVPPSLEVANLTQGTARIRLRNTISTNYVQHLLLSDFMRRKIMTLAKGSTFREVSLKDLRGLEIPLPPLSEQIAIARILASWDHGADALERLIKLKRERKRGLMQVLLTGKKRFKEFSAERWKTVTLGSQLEQIVGGGTPSRARSDYWATDGIPWISVKDLRAEHISSTVESITDLGLAKSSANLIPANTVIIATRMAVGKSVRSSVPAAINQDLKALFPKHTLRADFLQLVAQRAQPSLEAVATGSTVKGIRLKDLRDITFGLPSTREQQKIADVIATADQEIDNLEKQLEAYKLQKRGLMQQLLTGKKRVNLNKLEPVTT